MNKLKIVIALCLVSTVFVSCNTKPTDQSDKNGLLAGVNYTQKGKKQIDKIKVFQAALDGNLKTVQEALNYGFDPNALDKNNRTALMLAAYNGHFEIVKLLIGHSADVNLTDDVDRTALMFASTGPFEDTVLALLQAGAKPNLTEKEQNWTAAMMAAAEGQLEVLKILVERGADLKMVDVDGESSLDFAESRGHSALAEYIRGQMNQ